MRWFAIGLRPASLAGSVVIPVRDEAANIAALGAELSATLDRLPEAWECVWVDDGSTDGTSAELARLAARDARHRRVALPGGHGQSAALATGFGAARGELFATLDGDGQSDPADLPRMVRLLREEGLDVVNGYRERRRDNRVRRLSSRIANGFRNRLTGEQVRDVGCSVRVFRRGAVEGLLVFRGMHRFLPTLMRMNGFGRIAEVPVNHRPRRHGQTKYGIGNRLWVGIADTLAVRWMQRRGASPPAVREEP